MVTVTFKEIKALNHGCYIVRERGWLYVKVFNPDAEQVYLRAETVEPRYIKLVGPMNAAILDLAHKYDLWDISVHRHNAHSIILRAFGRKHSTWVLDAGMYVKQKRVRNLTRRK